MSVETIEKEGVIIVKPTETCLDVKTSKEFRSFVQSFKCPEPMVVLDMSNITFMDSTGLGAILLLCRKVDAVGAEIRLAALNDQALSVLSLVNMTKSLDIYDSVEDALVPLDA